MNIGSIGIKYPGDTVTVEVTVVNNSTSNGQTCPANFDLGYQAGLSGEYDYLPQTFKTLNLAAGETKKINFSFVIPEEAGGKSVDIVAFLFPAGNHNDNPLAIETVTFTVYPSLPSYIPNPAGTETMDSVVVSFGGTASSSTTAGEQVFTFPGTTAGQFQVTSMPVKISTEQQFSARVLLSTSIIRTWSEYMCQLALFSGDRFVGYIGVGQSAFVPSDGTPPSSFYINSANDRIALIPGGIYDLIATLSQSVGLDTNPDVDGRSVRYILAQVTIGKVEVL